MIFKQFVCVWHACAHMHVFVCVRVYSNVLHVRVHACSYVLHGVTCVCVMCMSAHVHMCTVHRKYLEGEVLANLVTSWQFAKFLPSKCLSFTIQIACKIKFTNILPSKS